MAEATCPNFAEAKSPVPSRDAILSRQHLLDPVCAESCLKGLNECSGRWRKKMDDLERTARVAAEFAMNVKLSSDYRVPRESVHNVLSL